MSSACTPILVGVVSPVSEIKLAPILVGVVSLGFGDKISLVHVSGKILIDWNRLKKFMQAGINVNACTASFGGRGLSGFGDMATYQKRPNYPFRKNLINRNWLKKFMQVGVNVTVHAPVLVGRGLSGFGDIATFQKRPNFPFKAWTIVHGHQKILSIGIGSKNLCK